MSEILLIDGDADFSSHLAAELSVRGHAAILSSDGSGMMEYAQQKHVGAIILCVELANNANGFALCRRFKGDNDVKNIPLILTTGKSDPKVFEDHRKLKTRADEYLYKPFSVDDLLNVLAQFPQFAASNNDAASTPADALASLSESAMLDAFNAIDSLGSLPSLPSIPTPPMEFDEELIDGNHSLLSESLPPLPIEADDIEAIEAISEHPTSLLHDPMDTINPIDATSLALEAVSVVEPVVPVEPAESAASVGTAGMTDVVESAVHAEHESILAEDHTTLIPMAAENAPVYDDSLQFDPAALLAQLPDSPNSDDAIAHSVESLVAALPHMPADAFIADDVDGEEMPAPDFPSSASNSTYGFTSVEAPVVEDATHFVESVAADPTSPLSDVAPTPVPASAAHEIHEADALGILDFHPPDMDFTDGELADLAPASATMPSSASLVAEAAAVMSIHASAPIATTAAAMHVENPVSFSTDDEVFEAMPAPHVETITTSSPLSMGSAPMHDEREQELRRDNVELRAKLAEYEAKIQLLERTVQQNPNAGATISTSAATAARETLALREQLRGKDREMLALRDELFDKEKAQIESLEIIEKLEHENSQLRSQLHQTDAARSAESAKVRSLQESYNELQRSETQLRNHIDALNNEKTRLYGSYTDMQQQFADVQNRLTESETQRRATEEARRTTETHLAEIYQQLKHEENIRNKASQAIAIAASLLAGEVDLGSEDHTMDPRSVVEHS